MTEVHWLKQPEAHDYAAANDYLQLVASPAKATALAEELEKAEMSQFKAKDILRSSRLEHLPKDNFHVARDLKKIADNVELSPILLIRGDLATNRPLTIADGYHRACAALHLDENIEVPCKIVDL